MSVVGAASSPDLGAQQGCLQECPSFLCVVIAPPPLFLLYPPIAPPHFLSVYFFSVSFCPCLPGPLGLDKLPPTSPPCPLTA